jgi:GxxExxY protein
MNGMNLNEETNRLPLDQLLRLVVGACYEVSNVLGSGFLEKVYERALCEELALRGVRVESQVPISVSYKGKVVGEYICDILVDGRLIVELKCCEKLADEHVAQCINYLYATGMTMLLLVNFQNPHIEWRRIVPRRGNSVREEPATYEAIPVHPVHPG